MSPLPPTRRIVLPALLGAALLSWTGCAPKPPASSALAAKPRTVDDTAIYAGEAIGAPFTGKPWIANLHPVDLDKDGLLDVLVADASTNSITWVRQTAPGKFTESVLAADLPAPVHVDAVDIDGDGDLDLLVACMGKVFPNNEKIGSVIILENDGHQNFTKHVVLENVARVTDVRAADFDRDGKLDLSVAQFGYDQGEIRWMRNLGHWQFESHILLSLSGTINVCNADMNGDGTTDIVAVVSQQWEEIYLFENDGSGNFTHKVIYGSTNEDFGSSGISLCDLNRDGKPDVLYTNGDGFDYAEPGARPWHGVQWLENLGGGMFKYHRIGDLPGAYCPVGVDLNGDGAMDVVAVSGFNDWKNPQSVSLMVFQNDGKMNFTPHALAHLPTHLMTCTVGNFDGTGKPSIMTGCFYAYPPFDQMGRLTLWHRKAEK
ncbi:MAG TPA: VCBS repeat-containing protein [Candidatus Didemnitutus sp.]|nr:VCBS repeat-containing protein [Candidatus Didemnitutus sp.]